MHITAIVVAAGRGIRFGSDKSKLLSKIDFKPVIAYSLDVFNRHPAVTDIIVVVNSANIDGIRAQIKKYKIKKAREIVRGGARRQDSVYNALKKLDKRAELVIVHDAARPFISKELVSRAIKQALKSGAAIVGVPVKATVKEASGYIVKRTLNRDNLWEIQTPQVFKKNIILEAYKRFRNQDVTDDASLIERLGRKVYLVQGSYANIKITTPEDLSIAKVLEGVR